MTTDTSKCGLERLICTALTGRPCDPPREGHVAEAARGDGGTGWICGNPQDYDREFCVDRVQLAGFLKATQPEALGIGQGGRVEDIPNRLAHLSGLLPVVGMDLSILGQVELAPLPGNRRPHCAPGSPADPRDHHWPPLRLPSSPVLATPVRTLSSGLRLH